MVVRETVSSGIVVEMVFSGVGGFDFTSVGDDVGLDCATLDVVLGIFAGIGDDLGSLDGVLGIVVGMGDDRGRVQGVDVGVASAGHHRSLCPAQLLGMAFASELG